MWGNTLTLVTLIYLIQGIGVSYVGNIYKPALEHIGLNNVLQGIVVSLVLVPFLLKIPLDRLTQRGLRAQTISIGSLIGTLISACLVFLTLPATPMLVSSLLFIIILCIAVCDVGADGIAVDRSTSQFGFKNTIKIQAMMFTARALGIAIGAILFTILNRLGQDSLSFLVYMFVFLAITWTSRNFSLAPPAHSSQKNYTRFTRSDFLQLCKVSVAGALAFMVWGAVETLSSSIPNSPAIQFANQDFSDPVGSAMRTTGIIAASLWIYRSAISFRNKTAVAASFMLSISCMVLLVTESIPIYLASQFIYGFALTTVFVWLTSIIVRNANPKYGSLSFTLVATLCNIGFIISPTLFGIIGASYGEGIFALCVSTTATTLGIYILFVFGRPFITHLAKQGSRV